MRVNAVNDESVKRSLELEVCYLSLFEVQSESWARDLDCEACRSQHRGLRWGLVVVECLALCFRRQTQ
jgi:hypothetical protein